MAILKERPAEEMEVANRIQEEGLAYSQAETQKPLVTELWAIRGKTNEVRVKQIASQSKSKAKEAQKSCELKEASFYCAIESVPLLNSSSIP